MNVKKIKDNNEPRFLLDIRKVREVMVYVDKTNSFFKVRKREVLEKAETKEIRYYITDEIFVQKRNSMVLT